MYTKRSSITPDSCLYCRAYSGKQASTTGWCMKRRQSMRASDTCGSFRPIDDTPRRYEQIVKVNIYPLK